MRGLEVPDNLVRRGGIWLFFRRTPIKFLHLEERSIVQQSTRIRGVDDPKGIAQPRSQRNSATRWRAVGPLSLMARPQKRAANKISPLRRHID